MTEARPSDYWLSNSALYIQLNAVGDHDYIHANCASGSKFMCYMRGIDGLGYDNAHNYRRWDLKASPTVFHDTVERYVYIAIPKNKNITEAQVVFPSQHIDIYGCDAAGNQIATADFYYIFTQGIITASVIAGVQKPREWRVNIDTGSLASDEAIASGGDSSWWRWDSITDTVTFLKDIASATIRNLTAAFAKITQLSLGGHLINGVADETTSDDSDDRLLTPKAARSKFLSKTRADRTPYPLNVGGRLTAEAGAHFGDFIAGQFTGRGGAVDAAGNAEFESIISRSYLKVMELIYNRLNAQEGDTSFSDFGTIEEVFTDDNGNLVAQIRKRWEGDFTAFQPGDIIYGYVNNLDKADVKEWYKSWAWIKSVDRSSNQLIIVQYPDTEVPSGINHPMTAGMNITRYGNIIEATEEAYNNPDYKLVIGKRTDGTYYNKRQSTFFISTSDGNLVELMGVNRPIIENFNYGTILGKIPEGLLDPKTEELINKGQPYLYARGIIVQDLIRIGYEGLPTRSANYRGYWDALTAASDTKYYRNTVSMFDIVTYEGNLWQCVVGRASAEPPSEQNPSWVRMTSDGSLRIWTINPSVNIVSVRADEVVPAFLDCTVTLNRSGNSPVTFDSSADLFDEGARLFYSFDGETWHPYIMGDTGVLELEDGSGFIETEDSSDSDGYLALGGDTIDTATITDRIYFELREVDTDALLSATQVPVVKDGARGSFQSTVFIRTNDEPDTPTGGTYDSPIPTGTPQWHDGIPEGEEILWASTRIFRDNMETEWDRPRQMTDTATFDVEFSDVDENPGNPTDNPENWHDPDSDGFDSKSMLWRAERHKKNGVWCDWEIFRTKGEKGDPGVSGSWTSYAFKESTTQPDTPTNTENTIPDGWSDAPSGEGRWWMSFAIIDGATGKPGPWSEPVPVTGLDGVPGSTPDFKFRVYDEGLTPLKVENKRHPDGWSDAPTRIDEGQALWMIYAEIDHDDNLIGQWSKPTRISGEKGDDGGVIYLWTITPSANIVSVRRNEVIPSKLTATVSLSTSLGEPMVFDNGVDLYDAGARLYFSLDGIEWQQFVMGTSEPLELEDGTGLIELEDSEDGSLYLSLGGDDIDTSTIGDRIFFELRSVSDSAILASTQVPVVKDGQDGQPGAPGRSGLIAYYTGDYDENTEYRAQDGTTPVVKYGEEYYCLKDNTVYLGSLKDDSRDTPAEDVAMNDTDTVWIHFDKFQAIYTNIVMADFAKLASAVFYGDWMISQYGRWNGEESDQYQHFKDSTNPFDPYLSINFLTGEIRALNGVFEGNINATSGTIGGFTISNSHLQGDGLSLFPTHIRFSNDDESRYVMIGENVLPGTTGVAAIARFTNSEYSSYNTNYGIIVEASNAAHNIAVKGKGNIVTDGYCGSHTCKSVTLESGIVPVIVPNTNTVIVKSNVDNGYIALPDRNAVWREFGLSDSSPFSVRITIIADAANTKTFWVYGRNTEIKNNGTPILDNERYPYRLDNNANRQTSSALQMGKGDIVEFQLVFDGSTYNAYLLNSRE